MKDDVPISGFGTVLHIGLLDLERFGSKGSSCRARGSGDVTNNHLWYMTSCMTMVECHTVKLQLLCHMVEPRLVPHGQTKQLDSDVSLPLLDIVGHGLTHNFDPLVKPRARSDPFGRLWALDVGLVGHAPCWTYLHGPNDRHVIRSSYYMHASCR